MAGETREESKGKGWIPRRRRVRTRRTAEAETQSADVRAQDRLGHLPRRAAAADPPGPGDPTRPRLQGDAAPRQPPAPGAGSCRAASRVEACRAAWTASVPARQGWSDPAPLQPRSARIARPPPRAWAPRHPPPRPRGGGAGARRPAARAGGGRGADPRADGGVHVVHGPGQGAGAGGRGRGPGRPCRSRAKACCMEVRRWAPLGVGVGGEDVDGQHEAGPVEVVGRTEHLAVDARGRLQRVGREVRGEGVGKPQMRGELRARRARSPGSTPGPACPRRAARARGRPPAAGRGRPGAPRCRGESRPPPPMPRRSARATARSPPGARPRPRSMRPGCRVASVPKASATA